MSELRRVAQEATNDCMRATLAMLLGRPLAAIDDASVNHFARGQVELAMEREGWFSRTVYITYDGSWPPAPFADRHYARVLNGEVEHAVAIDAGGVVLDPARPGEFRLTDWETVIAVTGFYMPTDAQEVMQ